MFIALGLAALGVLLHFVTRASNKPVRQVLAEAREITSKSYPPNIFLDTYGKTHNFSDRRNV